jgi:hypothetical protein
MTNFSREIMNFSKFEMQWNNLNIGANSFLQEIKDKLVKKGEALLTVRKDQVTVYYNGNRLCNMYSPDFEPTVSELFLPLLRSSLLIKRVNKTVNDYEYINEDEWKRKAHIDANAEGMAYYFSDVWTEICSNITSHQTPESYQVSKLYKYSPLNPNNDAPIVLLDVEAVFAVPGTRKSERIDLVFYDKEEQQLIFVEAKGLWDDRLKPKKNNPPEIIDQMSRYEAILKNQQEKANIKTQYNRVIDYYNKLGGTHLNPISDKDPTLGLLLFGYSDAERKDKKGSLAKVKKMLKKEKIKHYSIGDTDSFKSKTLIAMCKRFNTK